MHAYGISNMKIVFRLKRLVSGYIWESPNHFEPTGSFGIRTQQKVAVTKWLPWKVEPASKDLVLWWYLMPKQVFKSAQPIKSLTASKKPCWAIAPPS